MNYLLRLPPIAFLLLLAANATVAADSLWVLENVESRFEFVLGEGGLFLRSATQKADAVKIEFTDRRPLFAWPAGGTVRTVDIRQGRTSPTAYRPAHSTLEIVQQQGERELHRRFELYDGAAAVRCVHQLTGSWPRASGPATESSTGVEQASSSTDGGGGNSFAVGLPGRHWALTAVRFRDQTDHHNDLVQQDHYLLFPNSTRARGNLLIGHEGLTDRHFWLLREAPLGESQLDDVGYDYTFNFQGLSVPGRRYGWVLGVGRGDEGAAQAGLRAFQLSAYRYRPSRDEMVMMNTWGDRGQDGKVNEAFVLRELEIAAAMGITRFQIDDGWQAGLSRNSADASGNRWSYWKAADWTVHPQRFPDGLGPVVRRAKELGVTLGLWFNASSENDYAAWRRDAEILIGLYRDYGIRTFKMDGLSIPTGESEANLRRLFDTVREATAGEVIFNLDVTAGRRGGYFYLTEYGNVFLENRYTDWGKYYPHWTLRNLWQLAAYVPAARLQIEFLNPDRNPDRYPEDDPLAPGQYSLDYLFAITAVAQPLAWMEGSNLNEEQQRTGVIHSFAPYLEHIHTNPTFPIGDPPDGTAWTGFQTTVSDSSGYLLLFREYNDEPVGEVDTRLPGDTDIKLESLVGSGAGGRVRTGERGEVPVSLPMPRTFALYHYTVVQPPR